MRTATRTSGGAALDVERLRADFPALAAEVHGKPLAYLDNAATSHKPQAVLDAEMRFYRESNANVHRGVHFLSERATAAYEAARETVRRHLNAAEAAEIVFVRGTTEAVNLVAATFGAERVAAGDEVLVTGLEHHSNIVPWQLLCERRGARLAVAALDERGQVDLEDFERKLTERTRMVAVIHVSNALGTINPVAEMTRRAHARGIPVLVDGAQAVPHMPVDVRQIGADFYAFSSHKAFGPTGAGALYGKREHLEAMPPYQGGGEMIRSVTFEKSEYQEVPFKFEAGTPNIAGSVAMGAALDYLAAIDPAAIAAHEAALLAAATERLSAIPGLRIIGTAEHKAAVVSFVLDGIHAHDVGTILDREGIAVRTGHHCAQPVMARFGVPATARASFALYNTLEEVERLAAGIERVCEVLG